LASNPSLVATNPLLFKVESSDHTPSGEITDDDPQPSGANSYKPFFCSPLSLRTNKLERLSLMRLFSLA
jgi:hypothetical protein